MTQALVPEAAVADSRPTIAAGRLAPWQMGTLEPAPAPARRPWLSIVGPGLLLAGAAVGAGEWLFGPAVSAQYGGTLLWLATISIVLQVFYNLEVMRYALYCGEPIFVGFFRTPPGPRWWTACYLTLFLAHIWPFMASNAAVPLAAACLGHLPGEGTVAVLGATISESHLVKGLGFAVFFASLAVLFFGGTVYRMLEVVMTIKLGVLIAFLVAVNVLFVSWANMREVLTGFVRFGSIPIRADVVVAGENFSIMRQEGAARYQLQGSVRDGAAQGLSLDVTNHQGRRGYEPGVPLSAAAAEIKNDMAARAVALARPGQFYVETSEPQRVAVAGAIEDSRWIPRSIEISVAGEVRQSASLDVCPEPQRSVARALVENQGFERQSLWSYWKAHGRLPDLNWGVVAAFAAIAGAGGLSNALFSNYARDKGWGMGAQTGAIPSAIGGRAVALSHVGRAFIPGPESADRWRAWRRYVLRDQVGVWMMCSFVGMALPCMMSLQFIRNAPVSGMRVAAMTAEGISSQFPTWAGTWWCVTLAVSFLALAPNSVFSGDLIARTWTDLLWIGSPRLRRFGEGSVAYVYYALLGVYAVWGTAALAWLDPLQIATLGAVLGNIALGFSAFHTLYVNRTLLPRDLRPGLFMQAGLVACGTFFLLITAVAAYYH